MVVTASSGREEFCQRRFPQRIAGRLVSFALLVAAGAGAAAEPPEQHLTIDYDGLPIVAFSANGASSTEILDQLAAALHIQIDYATPVVQSRAISGSFKGEVDDILRRVLLPDAGYVVWYRGSAIDRIFITSSGAAAIAAAATPPADAAEAAAAAEAAPAARPAAPAARIASGGAGRAQRSGNPLSNILQAQASTMQQSVANAGPGNRSGAPVSGVATASSATPSSSSPAAATQTSLAAMTRSAQANVVMLAKALTAVCIGANCAQ
jgi:hypothetical protein